MAKPARESADLASSLVNSVTQTMGKLLDLWNAMGVSKELQSERMAMVKMHIEILLNEMLQEEHNLKEKIENDIEMQKNHLNMIRHELRLDSYQIDDGLTIIQLVKQLRQALEGALKEKEERLKKMKQLQQEDQALCTELWSTPYYIPTGTVPSCLELAELNEHVRQLLKVKEQRLEAFFKLMREIRQCFKETGHIPDGTLENDILSDEEECICLTKNHLEDLQLLVHKLQGKKEGFNYHQADLIKRVQLLWDRLQWSQEKQEQLMRKTKKNWMITGKKCFYADLQRAAFQPFYNDDFSEEVLKQHDEELLKIKEVYEKNKYLYDGIHKWEAIWDRFIELEKKSTDPSRLLNRGGNLLKDERERAKIQKQLLKVAEELKKSIESWEVENSSSFLVNNSRFLDSMAHQLEQHKLKKDKPKISVKRDEFATPKAAAKRPADVNTPTPNKIHKVASNLTVLKASSCINIPSREKASGETNTPSPKLSLLPPSAISPPVTACPVVLKTNFLTVSVNSVPAPRVEKACSKEKARWDPIRY
uniref:Protein regulator of cytokinesis 1 n=1 Tax=Salvator merianae TaxID=96440 RepID=A0A8D0BLN0_SALMN